MNAKMYVKYRLEEAARRSKELLEIMDGVASGWEMQEEAQNILREITEKARERAESYRVGAIIFTDHYGGYEIISIHKDTADAAKAIKSVIDAKYGSCDEEVDGNVQYSHPNSPLRPVRNDGVVHEVLQSEDGEWHPKR